MADGSPRNANAHSNNVTVGGETDNSPPRSGLVQLWIRVRLRLLFRPDTLFRPGTLFRLDTLSILAHLTTATVVKGHRFFEFRLPGSMFICTLHRYLPKSRALNNVK